MTRAVARVGAGLAALVLLGACAGETRESPELAAPSETRWEEARTPSDLALLEAPARVVPGPLGQARVGAPFSARVLAVHVRAGDRVEIGTPLVDVSMPAVLDAAARWASSGPRRSLRSARRTELASLRSEGLVPTGSVYEQEAQLVDLDAERAQALAVLHAASVRESEAAGVLRTGRVVLTSPIAGLVRSVEATLGETRDPSGPAFVEVASDVAARVEVRFSQAPPEGARFTFHAQGGEEVELGAIVASLLDPSNGTRVAWLDPVGDARLPAGLAGHVRVVLANDAAVEIPTSALIVTATGAEVERAREGASAERVHVDVVAATPTRAIVRGVSLGDRIAVDPVRPAARGAE